MSFPVFASGDVLNASDMNAVGLWLVKSQTVPAGGTAFTVTQAFSANYDNYRIIFENIGGQAGLSAFMTINGSTGATYSFGGRFFGYTLGNGDANSGPAVGGFWCGIMGTNFSGSIELQKPFLATPTTQQFHSAGASYANIGGGYDSNAASSTAFTITLSGGTLTAGNVYVYGYKK